MKDCPFDGWLEVELPDVIVVEDCWAWMDTEPNGTDLVRQEYIGKTLEWVFLGDPEERAYKLYRRTEPYPEGYFDVEEEEIERPRVLGKSEPLPLP